MKLCMVFLIAITTIILARSTLIPCHDGAPAGHFHGQVAIMGLANRDLARSRMFLITVQDLV